MWKNFTVSSWLTDLITDNGHFCENLANIRLSILMLLYQHSQKIQNKQNKTTSKEKHMQLNNSF